MARKHTRTRLLSGRPDQRGHGGVADVLASPPAQAAPPAPPNLQATGDPIPVLSWDRVDAATSYGSRARDAPTRPHRLQTIETTNIPTCPPACSKEGDALLARPGRSTGPATSAWAEPLTTTIIGTHLAPTGLTITPANATAAIMPPVEPPVIRGTASPGAIGYDVEMDGEGDGVGGILKTNIKTTTYVWPDPQGVGETGGHRGLLRPGARQVRQRPSDRAWSDSCRRLRRRPASARHLRGHLPQPVCSAPRPASHRCPTLDRHVEDVVFDWDPVRGAKQYEIWVSQDAPSATPIEKRIVSGTRYSPKTTYGNDDYFWKVRAINAAGQPPALAGPPASVHAPLARRRRRGLPAELGLDHRRRPVLPVDAGPARHPLRARRRHRPQLHPGHPDVPDRPDDVHRRLRAATRASPEPCGSARGRPTTGRSGRSTSPGASTGSTRPFRQCVLRSGPDHRLSPAQGSTTGDPSLRWSANSATAPYQKYHVYLYDNTSTLVDHKITRAQSWTPEVPLDPAKNPTTGESVDSAPSTTRQSCGRAASATHRPHRVNAAEGEPLRVRRQQSTVPEPQLAAHRRTPTTTA